ncbi:MAG: hypothetical protein F4X19_14415 [Acidobacteria bacterium]|nr:hypothetical protein [Acidobacteriota bacterium]MYC83267.1 hypothetical protein [Acidobacteriota bacterium]
MPTQCNTKPLEFEPHGRRRVVADFDGGPITSDAGALLLRRVDRRLSLSDMDCGCPYQREFRLGSPASLNYTDLTVTPGP